jgi:HD-GYP domain-containing protein (c-di-GMP phosphodiesterase class II)
VRAIELTDPYLAGHSRMMGKIAVEIAKAMNASEMDVATVAAAANLSQVGKLFVDRELLSKAEVLTVEEQAKMAQHVEHAARVLKEIDFGLPIYEAVCQMNETLDGNGYPKGLRGDEITLPARILAVANSFCAMLEPRAYRAARPVDEIMAILDSGEGVYDQRVVAALKDIMDSASGEKLLAGR